MSPQIISALAAIFTFGSIALVYLGVQASRAKAATPEMEERLERFGSASEAASAATDEHISATPVADQLERAVKGRTFSETTRIALARADLRMTIGEWLAVRITAAIMGGMLGLFVGRSSMGLAMLFFIVLGAVGWMAPHFYLSHRAKKRTKAFVNQLGDTIGLMANSLRAGYSLLQTMELISRESPAPMCDEFRRVVREIGLGVSSQQALDNLLRRIPSEDLDLMVSAISIQHEVGGNLGQILDVIGETIRERVRIKGEIAVLTSQQSLSGYVISGLPLALGFGLFLMNRDYMLGMFVWPWICLPIGALILEAIGFMVMKKIVAIEV
ncbi:MAG: type II secretion system F family protein [Chloroflexia bacterium]|nr:type II secretion system F family protein [Chloroflexia bacterium]